MLFSLSFFLIYFLFNQLASAAGLTSKDILLEDYGQFLGDKFTQALQSGQSDTAVAEYINFLIKLAFGLGSISAVVMIVWGGIEYITSETFSKKNGGKEKIKLSLGALLLLIAAFIAFKVINPELLKVRIDVLGVGAKVNNKSFNPGNIEAPSFGIKAENNKYDAYINLGWEKDCNDTGWWTYDEDDYLNCEKARSQWKTHYPNAVEVSPGCVKRDKSWKYDGAFCFFYTTDKNKANADIKGAKAVLDIWNNLDQDSYKKEDRQFKSEEECQAYIEAEKNKASQPGYMVREFYNNKCYCYDKDGGKFCSLFSKKYAFYSKEWRIAKNEKYSNYKEVEVNNLAQCQKELKVYNKGDKSNKCYFYNKKYRYFILEHGFDYYNNSKNGYIAIKKDTLEECKKDRQKYLNLRPTKCYSHASWSSLGIEYIYFYKK